MNERPKISVIVPFYNAARFLRQCIDSIIRQTFTDWELILIDDGSTDESCSIAEACMQNECRIKLIKVNRGG